MIKASAGEGGLQLSLDGTPIAVLSPRKLAFTLNGQDYAVRRKGAFAPLYELWCGEELRVLIRQALFVNRYEVACAGRQWTLKAEEITAKQFGLYDGTTRVGGITPASKFHYLRDITIDLPAEVPLEAQVFSMWVLNWKWDTSGS
jgi:hypothetical protein